MSFSLILSAGCVNLWLLYHTYVNTLTNPHILALDVKRPKSSSIAGSIEVVVMGLFFVGVLFINYLIIKKISTQALYWNMMMVSQHTVGYFFLTLMVLIAILCTTGSLRNQNISFAPEYLFFIVLITGMSYLLMGSANLLFAIFALEFIALLIFGKFSVSRILYTYNNITRTNTARTPRFSYGLFNSLFFQFWANFISSIFLFFALVNIHYMFGFSDFYLVNFFLSLLCTNWYFTELFVSTILWILMTGLFVKLGLAPYQFFKIETYKGIPLFMVIIYTTLYLIIYVYFVVSLLLYQVSILREFVGVFIFIMMVGSILYLVNLLFDTKNFKAFLSYSTLITVVSLLTGMLVL